MSKAQPTPREGGALTDWLALAAAPTFAIMALLTGLFGGGPMDALCSSAHGGSPFSGMIPMYLLMSAFHLPPWLKQIGRGGGASGPFRPDGPAR